MLWLACIAPSGRLGLTAVGGLFPMAATLAAGRVAGYLCWGAASLLGLFLLPDKGVALLFLMFFGLYPVVKERVESLRKKASRRRRRSWCRFLGQGSGKLTMTWSRVPGKTRFRRAKGPWPW